MIQEIYFGAFALVAVLCAASLLWARHPINGAMALIGTMVSLSGVYSLIASPFLATIQILVYAGAVMMLVVFVIMVLNTAKDHSVPRGDWRGYLALLAPLVIGALLLALFARTPAEVDPAAPRGTVAAVASILFDTTGSGYYVLFEVVGAVLLAAVVGAVLLAKRDLDSVPADPHHGGH